MKLKFISAIISCLLYSSLGYSQNSIAPVILQGNESFTFDHVFTSPSPLSFSLNENNKEGEWKVSLLQEDDTYTDIDFRVDEMGHCVFHPASISSETWRKARRFFDSQLQRDLYKIRISFQSKDESQSTKYVSLGLSPTRPLLTDITYDINEYDWEYDMIYPYGWFSLMAQSSGATMFYLLFTDSFFFEEKKPHLFFNHTYKFEGKEGAKIEYDADWGEFICIAAVNSFGSSRSDTILTTDYIKDEAIRNRIEEIKTQTGVDDIIAGESFPKPKWDNHALTFDKKVSEIIVCDMKGRTVARGNSLSAFDLSYLPHGIYIVTYLYECQLNNNINHIKIIKT